MILEAIVAAKTIAYTATTIYAWIIGTAAVTGGVSILGTVVIMNKNKSGSHSKTAKQLAKLEEEQQIRDSELPKSISNLVVQTDNLVTTATSNTLEVRGQIEQMTTALHDEVHVAQNANIQLRNISSLLETLADKVSEDLKPILFEIQDRLSDFSLIHDELNHVRARLSKTVEHLQSAVHKHTDIQKALAEDAHLDKEIIKSLSSKLEKAADKLSSAWRESAEKEPSLPEAINKQLVLRLTESHAQNEAYSSMIRTASQKISTLHEQNKLLQHTVESLSAELTTQQEAEYALPRSRSITMFR